MGKLLVIVLLLAVATYLITRALQERGQSQGVRRPGGLPKTLPRRQRKEPRRPTAPDDDDEFLRDLNRKKKHPPEDA